MTYHSNYYIIIMKNIGYLFAVLLFCNISFSQEKREQLSPENNVEKVVFKSYPNPVSEQLFVIGSNKIKSVEFLDASGKRTAFYKFNKRIIKINVSNLKKGTYLLKVIDERDRIQVKRLVVN